MPRTAKHSRRPTRTSCSIIALATVMAVGATPAAAQSLLGTGTYVTNPNATGITTAPNLTTINLNGGQTVIDWTPTDNATGTGTNITFQNAGTTALFTAGSDFAVLNRVLPTDTTRAIVMNGIVNSRVGGAQRGSVYFYSPSGFIFGGTSVFSVGSLVVSALPITLSGGNFINGPDNTVAFGQALNTSAAIVSNGTINANFAPLGVIPPSNSYVAMVAPRVVHNGSITANGSTALVAAEAATINFSPDGLFDIQVTAGSTDSAGVTVNGDITGPTPGGSNDKQRIYLVAVPKNDAMTMVIGNGADLGFTLANTAADVEGVIVLSAGHDIANGDIGARSAGHGANATANFSFTGAHATNNLIGEATGSASLFSVAAQPTTTFDSSVTVHADGNISMGASGAGTSLTVSNSLDLSTDRTGAAGQSLTAGNIDVYAQNGGSVSAGGIAGSVEMSAVAIGGAATSGTAGSGTGGNITVSAANGGTLSLRYLDASTRGIGGSGSSLNSANAGNGTGGVFSMFADTGGNITLGGIFGTDLFVDASGEAGSAWGTGVAGSGLGGTARIYVGDNATILVNGNAALLADGSGGFVENGLGGTGTGGSARLTAVAGSTAGGVLTITEGVNLSASGNGGWSSNGVGGTAVGGHAYMFSTAHHYVINGGVNISATALGGSGSTVGGAAIGGTAEIVSAGSEVDISGSTFLSAFAWGQDGALGGNATGGTVNISSQNDVTFTGDVFVDASSSGGEGFSNGGGASEGRSVNVTANGGDLTFTNLSIDANAYGGQADSAGTLSGNGLGGDISIQALSGGILNVADTLSASADGHGGETGFQADAGLGRGGDIVLNVSGAGSLVSVTNDVTLSADGFGGDELGDCFGCGGLGGDGFGGNIDISVEAAGALLDIGGELDATADGLGSTGFDADGGFGKGGTVQLFASNGGVIEVSGDVELGADGEGGWRDDNGYGGDLDAIAGDGEGGFVEIFTFGTGAPDINLLADVDMHADGLGGSNFVQGVPTFAGDGTGGIAWLDAQAGSIDITGTVGVTAKGTGGEATFGTGGTGTGKNAEIDAIGGSVTIAGGAIIDVSGLGGDGAVGGDGIGGGEQFDDGTGVDGAHIFAKNGSVSITGTATLSATGEGGQGVDGAFETIGGSGGNGTGGWAAVTAANSDLGPSSISLSSLTISASAFGGDGGLGGSGNQGGDGGDGGDALGGSVGVHAFAGNGHVTVTTLNASASATGGQGGNGGNGDSLGGGNGGDGGDARGGGASIGTASGSQALGSNLGTATYGTIFADGSATGGNGGNGSFGSTNGNGGDGGDAFGGHAGILVRGSTVTLTNAFLSANADGGDAGFGYQPNVGTPGATGIGGNASVGGDISGGVESDSGVGVLVTNRYLLPNQRGTLNAGSIHGTAIASSGIGIPDGNSMTLGGSHVTFVNSNATIGSLDFEVGFGGQNTSSTGHDSISLVNSTVGVAGAFSFTTPGDLSFYIDNGSLTAGTLNLAAGNFIIDPDHGAPVNRGTAFATGATITTQQDFIANANFDVDSNLAIAAPGLIDAHNFTIDGNLQLSATSGGISVDNLSTVGSVSLLANGRIETDTIGAGTSVFGRTNGTFTTLNIGAGTFIDIRSGGAMTLGNLNAGDYIDLRSSGPILFQNAISGETINLQTLGSLTTGNLTAGDSILGQAIGAISVGTLSAGLIDPSAAPGARYRTSLASDTGITTGNIAAAGDIGFGTPGNLQTGALNSGAGLMALVGGNINALDVTATGYVYLANYSMSALGGTFESFDRAPILASAPTPTGGSITLGNVNTGRFTAAAGTSLTTGVINSGTGIGLGAGGAITTGNLFAGDFVLANGGSITTQNIVANSIDMTSGSNITTANLTVGDSVEIDAAGAVTTGNISAGLVNPSTSPDADYFAVIRAGGAISTGNIEAAQNVGLATPGTITTADIDAGGIFMALGHGNMLFGDATASEVFLADFGALLFGSGGGGGGGGGGIANCIGTCGTLGPNGVVTAPPSGSSYAYLTTELGVDGAGQLPGAGTAEGATNGSLYSTAFDAAAGDDLNFWFNYVTSDGSGFADYAWAALLTASLDPVATLFTARTQPNGTIVPGQGLPGVEATLTPASVPIIDGAPVWSPLGTSSGTCYDVGCGFTGWISSTYEIANAGSYVLRFGVSNWTDTAYQSGMAFSGITIGGVPVATGAARTGGSITIGNVDTGKFTAAAGTSLTTGVVNSTGSIDMDAGGAITTGNLFAGTFLHANGGSITTQNLTGPDIELEAVTNIAFGAVNGGEFDFSAGGSVTGGNIVVTEKATGDSGGTVTLGNISAGPTIPVDDFSVGIAAIGNISVGNVSGAGHVGFATQGNLATGNLSSGDLVMTLVGGNTTTGAIATGAGGQVYMADDSMFLTGGGTLNGDGDFDPAIVLALDPVATGGAITINGPVATGRFRAAAGTGLTTQAITASEIDARAIGTATINGLWSAPLATIASSDIDITATGGIAAGASGEVNLMSSNSQRMLIGDGLTGGGGYALSNAEFGRISGSDISIIAGAFPGAAADTFVGNLTVTAGATGNIRSANGGLAIIGLNEAGTERDGSMRVLGNVAGLGFGATNYLAFATETFELDAATGSVSLTSTGNALSGELDLFADRIHVASGAILNQLAANPTYSGYQQDLNRAATVQRPDGVLRASTLWIESDSLQDVLIQNTGSTAAPAGFLVNQAFVNEDSDVAGPPGSINLVVNGQVVTAGGTLTGIAARDELVTEDTDITPFTANSTINGCPLTGACVIQPDLPDLPAVVDDQIDLITFDPLGDSDFGNEPDIDDNEEGDGAAGNPISPPQPLFDTRPLIPASDVNDPVSGTGNPSLLGAECDKDEEGQCATVEETGQ